MPLTAQSLREGGTRINWTSCKAWGKRWAKGPLQRTGILQHGQDFRCKVEQRRGRGQQGHRESLTGAKGARAVSEWLSSAPQHLYNIESEIEESDYDSVEGSTSGASSDEWEDDSDSWETDNGLVDDEHPKIEDLAILPTEQPAAPEEDKGVVISEEAATAAIQGAVAMAAPVAGLMEKAGKDGPPKSFRELKEAIKILESLKNMTVEQLLTGSPTSPTVEPEKPTREKKFLDDIKKLQENLKKTLDNVAIAEEEKMEAVPDTERKEEKTEAQSPVKAEWPSETPVLCQQCGGKPGVTFTSAKGEVFSVLEFAPCELAGTAGVLPHAPPRISYPCPKG